MSLRSPRWFLPNWPVCIAERLEQLGESEGLFLALGGFERTRVAWQSDPANLDQATPAMDFEPRRRARNRRPTLARAWPGWVHIAIPLKSRCAVRCPLWVTSGHGGCNLRYPLYTHSGHSLRQSECLLVPEVDIQSKFSDIISWHRCDKG
jgi:hypothetical protein